MRVRLMILGLAVLSLAWPLQARARDVTVFAAASLKNGLDAAITAYEKETGRRAVVSYAASSALARQIEQGAPADLFFSADLDWMNHLQERGLVKPETRRNLVRNRIVLAAPKDGAKAIDLTPGSLAAALGGGRLAIANVTAVPAGKYGKAALTTLGLWPELADRLAQAENVRAALAFVSRGEAPLGLVYETDAKADPNVAVVARFPETSHPPIVYPVAVTASSTSPDAMRLLDALRRPESLAFFAREGFTPLD